MGRSSARTSAPQVFGQGQPVDVTTQAQAVPKLDNPGMPSFDAYGQAQASQMTPNNAGQQPYGGGYGANIDDIRQNMRESPFFGRLY